VTNFGNFDARNASGEVEVMDEEFWELVSVAQNRASAKLVTPAEPFRPTRKIVNLVPADGGLYGISEDGAVFRFAWHERIEGAAWLEAPPLPQPEPTP
jgi:hypothetical protein